MLLTRRSNSATLNESGAPKTERRRGGDDMDELHVVVGAGPIGTGVARRLAGQGHRVLVITRSGGGPEADGIELAAADASDTGAMIALTQGAAAIYNCAHPPCHR